MTEDRRQKTEKSVIRHASSVICFQGFTLIELLVVISIIAAILALLIPGLGRAKNLARRTQCASNLHQIDVAMHLYTGSNNDTYPAAQDPITPPNIWLWMGRGFRKFITPHLGGHIDAKKPSVLLCPTDKTAPVKWESTSYSYSMTFYHSPEQIDMDNIVDFTTDTNSIKPPMPQKLVNVAKPAGKIIIGEWLSNHRPITNSNDMGWWSRQGKRNYLFADGQVHFLDANDIRPAHDGNPNPNLTINGIRGIDWPK
jgi:prepilin-type N-terminal cleavage/methylation domain-containing protein/prepilin-type processing-associated H-X9-DG protein